MSNSRIYISFVLLFFSYTYLAEGQKLITNSTITGVTYAGNKVNRIYIPPPKRIYETKGINTGGTINVIYTGFSNQAQVAVDYAVNILEFMLPSDAKMTIKASWTRISSQGVLGNSSITGFAGGWGIDAFDPAAIFPVTIAEKIAGHSLNGENEADVELILNSTANWYLGTDGNTPVTKYDLVTVVLHELCHGLGFFDSMVALNNSGSYGFAGIPIIYDRFVENLLGENLTDTTLFLQDSKELYEQIVGGQLYFSGPLTRRYLSGSRARLYSPSVYDPGSSVSHLDELRTSQADALMTPYIDLGEAIHNPGKLTMSMLGDLGWINTRIIPEEMKDTEESLTEAELRVSVNSDTLYSKDLVGIVFSFDNFLTSDTIMMSETFSENSFSASVQIPSYNSKLDYYFFAIDDFLRVYRSPSLAEKSPYSLYIGTDTVKPVIAHTPAEYYFEKIDSLHFNTIVTDNLGVDSVFIEYRVNGNSPSYLGLELKDNDLFEASLDIIPEDLKGGDSFQYRIIARDKASVANMAVSPSTGYYTISIESLQPVVTSYFSDFSNAEADFFSSGFHIEKLTGFSSPGMHSDHPYDSPEEDYKTLEFSTVLRHPVVFNSSGMMISFRELVLVEPGEEGSVYGFSDFYDYVILEGSNDYGKTWFGLTDGYDSRIISSWESAYNSSIDGMNSTFVGTESMMIKRTFYPRLSGIISDGDSLLIRFRLFSDPYANGWGWVIDDLTISPLIDEVQKTEHSDITIFPNPGNGKINIRGDTGYNQGSLQVKIFNLEGKSIFNSTISPDDIMTIDISGNPPGLYLILLNNGKNFNTVRYNLIK